MLEFRGHFPLFYPYFAKSPDFFGRTYIRVEPYLLHAEVPRVPGTRRVRQCTVGGLVYAEYDRPLLGDGGAVLQVYVSQGFTEHLRYI